MKKVITFVMLFVMIFLSSSLAEQGTPFAEFSDEDLIECYRFTVELMKIRGLSFYSTDYGVVVPAGRYTVGVDIPAGTYRLEFPDVNYNSGMIYIYVPGKEYPDQWFHVGNAAQVPVYGKLELTDGMIFDLQDTTATFYTYKGLFNELHD